ncbi:MAG: bifunctional diaminohydroxyphosphoribosylaminopyrimidine deaminase/5-amino-6-(5-phosphoribosylamino)uracil reductase RibD [Bacteroidia bacterium]|nr:bifunctional diaminohydroxyphosphoribosylaminopyrimidine deaminase/5-amino-6-(5-phosphoribosylamino)uracil reductase RibD [Bacteroidia bacterium]
MKRCLQLAENGIGHVFTNPLVGCVLVEDNRIIGEGYHRFFGGPHAEVEAINSVRESHTLTHSTLYVNLEPCSHFGKTPPCCDLIISKGIPRVIIGMKDPFARVNGEGIKKLRAAGIHVEVGLLEDPCREINKRFICFHTRKRPYLVLKWAQSSNGMTGIRGQRMEISNRISKMYAHKWRQEEAGILVGSGTVLSDNPQLNTRLWQGPSPIRIIADRSGNLCGRHDLKVFDGSIRTLVLTQQDNPDYPHSEVIRIADHGDFFDASLQHLHQIGIISVLVEGGSRIHQLLLERNLWDECRVFVSRENLENGIPAPTLPAGARVDTMLEDNLLITIRNPDTV